MREIVLLVTLALAALLGMALGFGFSRPAQVVTIQLNAAPPSPAPAPTTKMVPAVSPPDPVDVNSTPVAIHDWRRADKDEIVRHVEKLPHSDADFLCLTLGLIPQDEIFDKVNVKGRLIRYVNGLGTAEQFSDLEAAFRQLERERTRSAGLPPN
jgi:hypothetical protein